jgi:aspartyl-tRNA(Asn)/glutamyl-tRNA(Gln) amidotransferase subunit B
MAEWETIIGLEVHVQLNTRSKLFSAAPNSFGDEPNTNITEVCTGQPGALPVLNAEAVHKAILLGCALNAKVAEVSSFDRKSYFYPDSPRNFQITQFYEPIVIGGEVVADVDGIPHTFSVEHAHLEDDAGMLKHFSNFSGVDYNRAGVPLVEIVSNPCMRNAQEAVAYATALKAICEYIDVSDCNMEEGHLRIDANISVRKKGETGFRNKTEIKNMNSFRNMELAIESEVKRQIREYERFPDLDPSQVISQMTLRYDSVADKLHEMRSKEFANDYRYCPEPDLVPLLIPAAHVEKVRGELPELPYARKRRYIDELELNDYTASIITNEKWLADYFEVGLAECGEARKLANWIMVEFFGRLKDTGETLRTKGILAAHIGNLVKLIEAGTITGKIAKSVADEMVANPGKSPEQIIAENPSFKPVADTGEVERIVDQVISENQQAVEDYRAGNNRTFGFLVGQVMQATGATAPPKLVTQLLKDKLAGQ